MSSASSWYQDFTKRLDAVNTRMVGAPSNNLGPNPLAGVSPGAGFDPTALFGKKPQTTVDHLKDWGGKALDLLARPGYAVGGVANAFFEKPADQVDIVGEFMQGLTGQDKRFFTPSEFDPIKSDNSTGDKVGRFLADFLASVGTDPVSYIPGAAIEKGLKAGADLTGLSKVAAGLKAGNKPNLEEDFLRTAEAAAPNADVAVPESRFISDKPFSLPPELTATPHQFGTGFEHLGPAPKEPLGQHYPPLGLDSRQPIGEITAGPRVGQVDPVPDGFIGPQGPTMPEPLVHAKPDNFDAVAQKAADFTGGMRKPAGLSERDHLHVLQLVRDSISHSLRTIKGTFNASEIKSPWRIVGNDTPLPTEPVRPNLVEPKAGQPFEQSVFANAVKRAEADASKHFNTDKEALSWARKNPDSELQAFVPSSGKFYWAGGEQDINSWLRDAEINGLGDLTTKDGLMAYLQANPNRRIAVAPAYGVGDKLTLPQYINMFGDKGNIPRTEIPVGGKMTSMKKYVDAKKAEWDARAVGSERAAYDEAMGKYAIDKQAYDKAFENYSPVTKAKPSREELQNFLRDNKIVLSKAEKKKLLNSANLGEKSFLGSLQKLAAQERRLNVESLDELAQMVKSGRVDQSVMDNIFSKLGVSTLGQAKKKLEVMDNAIARLQEKDVLRTRAEVTKEASKQIDATVSEGGFDPAVLGEVPRELPDPKIPVKEVIQTRDTVPSVTQAEAAVDRATTPDIAALLDEESKNRVFIAAKKAVDYEWSNWKKKYPHKTNRGAGRTDTTPGAGNAHWYGEFNAKKQYTFFKYALGSVQDAAGKAGVSLKGAEGATTKYNKVMPMLKAHDDLLRSYGIHPAAVPGGGYPVSLFDVLSILPQKWVEAHVFNTGRQVNVDQIMRIAQAAVDTKLVKTGVTEWGDELTHVATDLSGFAEVVRGILGKEYKNAVGNTAQDFAETIGSKAGARELSKTAKKHGFDPQAAPSNYVRDAQISGQHVADKTFSKGTLGPIVNEDFIRAIQEKVAYNSARADLQYGRFVQKASKEQVDKFIEAVNAAPTNDDVFKVVEGARKSVDSTLADTATIVPTKAAASEVKDTVEAATANVATEIAAKAMAANSTATTALKAAKAEQEVSRAFDDLTKAALQTETYDLSQDAYFSGLARSVHSIAPHIAEGDLRKIMLNNNVTAGHITAQYSRQLSQFQQRVGLEKANQLFHDVRLGHKPSEADAEAYTEMQKIVSRIFGDTENGATGGWSLQGNGIHPAHLNSNLRHFQVHDSFHLPTHGTPEEIYGAWRNFEAKDPLDLLSRYHAAVQKSIAEKNMGAQISNYFGSARYEPGMAKVRASNGKSALAHLINTDLYYPKDVIQNMFALDKTLRELRQPNASNKLVRLLDSATHAYKAGLTIYRPGHHMRNLYGDIWLGAMDGVYNPAYYKRAKSVMATRKEHYADYNFDASLSDLSGADGTAVTLRNGGREIRLSNNDVYRLAAKHGLLPNYSTIEDLNVGTTKGVSEMIQRVSPFKGKVHDAAADFSEYRDHWVRLAHFLKVLEDGKSLKVVGKGRQAELNAIDELASRASSRVQKWHPNGSDNTKFERNVLRRGILFYSWIRKAIPLVVETAVLHPGRFMAFPKAMYAMAEANGIDLNGFSDPFPTDQLFPSWLGGTQGPQFGSRSDGYIGMRMGIPMMDIMDQYFTDPGTAFQSVMSGTNPLVKVPFELSTGKTAQGIPVDDKAKYLLGQVPFGNFVNTMADKPIGGPSPSDANYDPSGIRDPKTLATINLLTGLGLMDMSKPSYIKSGEFDVKYGRQGG